MLSDKPTVGRLAPSPTGGLHMGHARTFLIAWLAARSAGGRLVLRIEDIDAGRCRPGMADEAVSVLNWLGLDWDEGPDCGGPNAPYLQSQRSGLYAQALEALKARELVYPCTCTRADIARMASAPHAGDGEIPYPGTCRGRCVPEADELVRAGRPFAWRFRVEPGEVVWLDQVRGEMRLDPAASGGDFVVARASGEPAYQLAVVVDDAAMGINQVTRGDDLLSSTPRQVRLYEALGKRPPRFAHVPLVLDSSMRRLAKRDRAIKLAELRAVGVDPQRLVGLLAQSCGLSPAAAPTRPSSLVPLFSFERLPRSAWQLTADLLKSLLQGPARDLESTLPEQYA